MSLGERIKTVRTDNGLTQKDFANLFGLSHSHISNLENNREKPSDTLLLFMCSKFGINYEWLKFGKADDTSKDENTRTFFTQLWETNFNTSKFNKEEISDDEIELKLLYTQKLYRELKELNNFFDKYQSLMFKDTYIELY